MNLIKRNLSWLLISQVATWAISIAVLVVAPRELGDKGFGQLAFAIVFVGFFDLIAGFGTVPFLMKTVARDASAVGRYVYNAVVLKLLVTLLLSVTAIGLAVTLGYSHQMVLLISTYCGGMVLNQAYYSLAGGLHGLQRMRIPAMWEVARAWTGGVIGLAVLMNGGSLLSFAVVFNLASIIPLVGNFAALWPQLRTRNHFELGLWREILVGGFPFFVLAGLVAFYGTIDVPMLEAFAGSETVGWYALAYRWVSVPAFFALNVSVAFFPALSAEGKVLSEAFVRMANRALHLVAFVATPVAVGLILVANSLIMELYGAQFHQSVPLMQILALHVPIVGVDMILGSVVAAADRQRQWMYVSIIAALVNPVLNLGAIPLSRHLFDNAAIGAAVVTVFTELVLMVGAIQLRPKGVLDRGTTRTVGRIVLASLAMVPVVLLLGGTPLPVRVMAGIVTYAVASLALRTISVEEVKNLFGGSFRRRRADPASLPEPDPQDTVLSPLARGLTEPLNTEPLTRLT